MTQFQSIGEVLAALRRRAVLIGAVILIGCVASVIFALAQPKSYEATAVVQIEEARIPDAMATPAAAGASDAASLRLRLIEQRLMARDNVLEIMDRLDLFLDDPEMSLSERVFQLRDSVRIVEIRGDAPSWQPATATGLYITAQLEDPEKAAMLANQLADSVVAQSAQRSERRIRDTFEFFVTESDRIEAEIARVEERLAQFKRQNAAILPEAVDALRSEIVSLREADLRLDQEIITLQNNATRQRQEVLDRQVALLREQKALIQVRTEAIEAQIRQAPEVERSLSALERELTGLREQYAVVTRRKAEAEMGQMLEDREQSDRFEILETALVPEDPVSRSRSRTAMLGGVASVLAALALAFVVEILNPVIRNAAQMERQLGIQPVVSIPYIHTRSDRSRGRWIWGGALLGLVLALFAAVRLGLDRYLPRVMQP